MKVASISLIAAAVLVAATPFVVSAAPKERTAFKVTNLISNRSTGATKQDTDLINPWGTVPGADGFFWVADNGSGKSTLYNAKGQKSSLVVTIPNPTGINPSKPTGQVDNRNPSDFLGDSFIFVTEEGTVVGWNGGFTGVVRANQSGAGSIYKGLALASSGGVNFLYAADFHNNRIDVYDSTYNLVQNQSPFVDPNTPAGFAPFNVHAVGSQLYVAYAKQDSGAVDDVAGTGNGFISIFNTDGTFVKRFVTGSNAGGSSAKLDSPWGLAVAPKSFGTFAGDILVGNFGSGKIAAFTKKGKFVSFLSTKSKKPIVLGGLWEIFFGGHGVGDAKKLYFSAGPNNEKDGLFGYLSPVSTSTSKPAAKPTKTPGQKPSPTPYVYPTYQYPY